MPASKVLSRRGLLLGSAAAGLVVSDFRNAWAVNPVTLATISSAPCRIVDTRDFASIDPTGTNDSTAAIQQAIQQQASAGSNYSLRFASGRYATTGLILDKISRIFCEGATFIPAGQFVGALITLPSAPALQTIDRAVLSGLRIDGGLKYRAPDIIAAIIGLDIGNNPALVLEDVGVKNCGIAVRFRGMQFASWRDVKAYACDVGFYSYQLQSAGGNNSNSFYDLQAINCKVGMIVRAHVSANVPNDGINLYNPTFINNDICALAVIGGRIIRPVVSVRGGNPEDTSKDVGLQPDLHFDGLKIPQCSLYANHGDVRLDQYQFEEAHDAGKKTILRNTSVLTLEKCRGPGAAGTMVDRDLSSQVVVLGTWDGAKNTIMGVSRWDAYPIGSDGFLITTVAPTFPSSAPNLMGDVSRGDSRGTFDGASAIYDHSNENPPYYACDYKACEIDGNESANAQRFDAPNNAQLAVFACEMNVSVDHEFIGRWLNNHQPRPFSLKVAEGWIRIVHVAIGLAADYAQYAIIAKAGPAVRAGFRNFHTWAGEDTPANRALVAEILRGGHTRKMLVLGAGMPTFRPYYINMEYIDQAARRIYRATGVDNDNFVALN